MEQLSNSSPSVNKIFEILNRPIRQKQKSFCIICELSVELGYHITTAKGHKKNFLLSLNNKLN